MLQPSFAELYRPSEKTRALLYDAALVIGGSLLMALLAQVAIPAGFSPVPITGQTFGVMLLGALLGWKRGGAAMIAYIGEGAAGLPFFAQGKFGVGVLLGTTGGYLVGFVVAAAVVGWLAERGWDRRVWTALAAMVIGSLVIYLFGVSWLAALIGLDKAVALGLVPFIPGDLAKIALATALLPSGWKLLAMTGQRRS